MSENNEMKAEYPATPDVMPVDYPDIMDASLPTNHEFYFGTPEDTALVDIQRHLRGSINMYYNGNHVGCFQTEIDFEAFLRQPHRDHDYEKRVYERYQV